MSHDRGSLTRDLRPITTLPAPEARRRIVQLMLFRVVLITLVLGTTVGLHLASPAELALPAATWLFAIVAATYALTLIYAATLKRVANPIRFADGQIAGDLLVTTALVHLTGGAQSGYVFFYPLSIIGAALVRYRPGALWAGLLSLILFVSVCLAGWLRWLPAPSGLRLDPADLPLWALIRLLVLNAGAFAAVAFLASLLGTHLAHAGARLETQQVRTADLAALNEDIIRCLSSGLLTIDADGRVLTCNEAASEILEIAPEAARGGRLSDLVQELDHLLKRLESKSRLRRGEVMVRSQRGTLTLGVSISPLTNHLDEPIGRVVNFQDLTELRRMEAEVRRGERLAMIGRMAANVAHEIRNPLASISGSIELLQTAWTGADEDTRALMQIVLREVDRLNGLVTDLLEYARPREPVMAPTDLGMLLDETVRVFAQDRKTHNVSVSYEPPRGSAMVHADAAQLRQVIWNLLHNAVDAMPSGGQVLVMLDQAAQEDGSFSAKIKVSDTGNGIAPEELERIFDPFYTTKARGSGLGLATVHRIVSDHGGTVIVSSSPQKGTEFTVLFPIAV